MRRLDAHGSWLLTIVGAGRDAWVVVRRGRFGTLCARGAYLALLGGRSTSPLDGAWDALAVMNAFARAFVLINRVFGAFAAFVGIYVLAGSVWGTLHGSQIYRGYIIGPIFFIVGVVYLRAPLSRQRPHERSSDTVSHND